MRLTKRTAAFATTVACALSLVTGAVAPAGAAQAAPAAKPKIEKEVLSAYAKSDKTDIWVRLADRADLSKARKLKGRAERGREVVDELKATAERSQEPVRKALRKAGLSGRSYWAVNAIHVRGVSEKDARELAAMPGVAEIRRSRTYKVQQPVASKEANAAQGLAWGLSDVHADQVWEKTGRRGEDIVIANVDTGVQYDHPALVRQYRGAGADGTFSHDYNWFDPSGVCRSKLPCDNNQHGTHTMGTMVGDDGKGNQIGVAPGAKWIAAKGCESSACSDANLLAASEWMLAPTDRDGRNPDPARRPDIVNNSWGTPPSNDPVFEDVQQAWAAAGIMGVWANGNEGPACATSGAPGSRTLNYSVGAYDAQHKVASFSSRGSGQDGEIKPNISAPGVAIRSAVPGGGYNELDGTSMATPHVAGAIALLWSARPEYAHDLAGTRALLDVSAVDTADDQCGGMAADNNVYGEGRLDALALIETGTAGLGSLSGKVTHDGEPVSGATVTVKGPLARTFTTGADGAYALRLMAGDYTVTATAFGYRTATATLTLPKNGALTEDIALTPTERVALTGKVTDGSGRGVPLPAKITAADGQGHTWSTTTATGDYTLPLLPDLAYTVTYTATEPGYDPATRKVALGGTGQSLDVALTVNIACTARGYKVVRDGATEAFGRGGRPKDWEVANVDPGIPHYAHKPGWEFGDPGKRGNRTGGSGGFAIVDSRNSGAGHLQNTYLTSPRYDLSARSKATIEFAHDLEPAVNSTTGVDLSVDGGRTWTTVWSAKGFPGAAGPATKVIPVPQAAGKPDVRYRLYYRGQSSGWWAVDDAFVGDRTCTPAT
ncbi:S8 family serine peptidase [Spirillospora sp. NPDC050679]